jgi:hypothetical protein
MNVQGCQLQLTAECHAANELATRPHAIVDQFQIEIPLQGGFLSGG